MAETKKDEWAGTSWHNEPGEDNEDKMKKQTLKVHFHQLFYYSKDNDICFTKWTLQQIQATIVLQLNQKE